ncbi:MAG TPA: hypothetical protein VGV57_08035 [Thermoleophilaceae bacterium]|nr:hypothetical protein [Thermoleophilaceae bacterium]
MTQRQIGAYVHLLEGEEAPALALADTLDGDNIEVAYGPRLDEMSPSPHR